MNGPVRARRARCGSTRASTSLPVPVGPLISTVMSALRDALGQREQRQALGIGGGRRLRAARPARGRSRCRSRHPRGRRRSAPGRRRGTASTVAALVADHDGARRQRRRLRRRRPGTGRRRRACRRRRAPIAKPCARSDETSAYCCRDLTAADGTNRTHQNFPLVPAAICRHCWLTPGKICRAAADYFRRVPGARARACARAAGADAIFRLKSGPRTGRSLALAARPFALGAAGIAGERRPTP